LLFYSCGNSGDNGKARKKDINLYAESMYEARREITDKDMNLYIYIENLSGKDYGIEYSDIILEVRKGIRWQKVDNLHMSEGSSLVSAWTNWPHHLFLRESLPVGRYRIRIPVQVLRVRGTVEVSCEFYVITHGDAQEPKWDKLRLIPSIYDASEQSTDVKLIAENPVLNKNNRVLDTTVTSDKEYRYGSEFRVEVLLENKWYRVPFAGSWGFTLDLAISEAGTKNFPFDIVPMCGILPVGQYRIIKEFNNEFAVVEFTVEETLEEIVEWQYAVRAAFYAALELYLF